MQRTALGIVVMLAPLSAAWADVPPRPIEGKSRTDRSVLLETVVAASASDVFRLFASEDGVKKFLAPDARIEPRLGGAYAVRFGPQAERARDGAGARFAHREPGTS